MIEVEQALSLVLAQARRREPDSVSVEQALGLVLAEDITSDTDSPPQDKSLVDGYALQTMDVSDNGARLTVLEEVTAGEVPTQTVTAGTATRIMTGAPIPQGADVVVMIERTELHGNIVQFNESQVRAGQNIMVRGVSMRRGESVLEAGREVRPADVGLLCEVGRTEVAAFPRPSVAVLATGNELVPPATTPGAGQIRNSNGPMLCALVRRAGGTPVDLGIGRDEVDELQRLIARGLDHDVLVLSGGVSAGVLDLVPGVLSNLGVEQVFHKVNLRPGKPLWFGVLAVADRPRLVFGLPGNPVSSLVCFELFARPAIAALAARETAELPTCVVRLGNDHVQRGNRPTYWPSLLDAQGDTPTVRTLDWQGSADLRTLATANCLAYFPAGQRRFAAGEEVRVHQLS